ncbi:MAG: transglycosylase SLT domain-containing protein [Patescibacteria group bacterium]
MKQTFVILTVLTTLFLFGCGTHPKVAEELPYYTRAETNFQLDSLSCVEQQRADSLTKVVDSFRVVLTEFDQRFREYRRNTMSNEIPDYVDFCEERVPIENPDVRERLYQQLLFMSENQAQLVMYYMRMLNFFPTIEPMLEEYGMPNDLKWICVIESGLKPKALSPANAGGWWQFIAVTGKRFNLDQSAYKDMRSNLIASTNSAVRYFDTLYAQFGDWALSCGAYNMGENGLARLMTEQGVDSYYDLWLPKETEAYLFRAIAAKLILSNPGSYGIMPEKFTEWQRQESDTVTVTVNNRLTAKFVAGVCGSTYRQIRLLNPELKEGQWEAGKHRITVPVGTRGKLQTALDELRKSKKKK